MSGTGIQTEPRPGSSALPAGDPWSDGAMGMTRRQRLGCLAAILISNFAFGVGFGGLSPLISLTLEGRGVPGNLIGLTSSMAGIGIIVMAPFVPRLVHRFGVPASIGLLSVLFVTAVAALPVFDSLGSWMFIRFLIGASLSAPWIITETWMNEIVPDRYRGRITALYGTAVAGGFTAGPVMLVLIGDQGSLPFFYYAGILGIAMLPLLAILPWAPPASVPTKSRISGIALAAPTIFGAAIVAGALDTTVFSLIPVWGLRAGLSQTEAITAVSIMLAGNLVMQVPIGWFGDRFGRRRAMILCSTMATISAIITPFLIDAWVPMLVVLFLWGGFGWALYTVSLAMMGQRFKGGQLAAANAAFIMCFEIGNILSPPTAGYALEAWVPHGMMVYMGGITFLFTIVVVTRGIIRRRKGSAE